jgi:hypothetical protein
VRAGFTGCLSVPRLGRSHALTTKMEQPWHLRNEPGITSRFEIGHAALRQEERSHAEHGNEGIRLDTPRSGRKNVPTREHGNEGIRLDTPRSGKNNVATREHGNEGIHAAERHEERSHAGAWDRGHQIGHAAERQEERSHAGAWERGHPRREPLGRKLRKLFPCCSSATRIEPRQPASFA